MRKSKKAAGAFLLSLVLLLGSVPVSVYADEIPVQTETEAVFDTEEKEEEIVVDVSDYILQAGGFVQEEETILEQPKLASPNNATSDENVVSDREGVIEVLCRAAENWDGTSPSVKVQMGDVVFLKEDVSSIYTQFVNEHPELFFITGRVGFSSRSGIVVSVTMYCDYEKYDLNSVELFDKTVSSILPKVESSWSEEQKALFLHDYIVTHCEYDLTLSNYSAYDTLVTGSSVCQGYALAYYYLLKQCGVDVSVISSEDMNHAWNQVVIDGQKYYADCTWDDSTIGSISTYYQDYCVHNNFLRSQDGFAENGHDSTDWADQNGAAVFDTLTGSKYEDAWWIGTVSAIPCVGNLWAYAPKDASVIYVHDYAEGSNQKLAEIDSDWSFIHLAAFDNHFYASFADKIYQIETDGAFDVIYELTEEELEAGCIYGIRIEEDYLYYRLYTSYDADTFAEEKRINLSAAPSHVHDWGKGKVIKAASCTEDGVRTYTCSGCGRTKSESIIATGHTKVMDPAVKAACTEPGLTEGSHCSVCGEVLKAQEEIPAKGHQFGAWTSTGKEKHKHTCSVCGTVESGNHTWGKPVITKKAAEGIEGILTYTCTACKQTKTETIPALPVWIRLAGTGRYDTMAEIVKNGFTKTGDTVVVATGAGFKDALAAAGLAGLYDAPVILTDGKNLSPQAQQQLKRLKPSRIYIAGGEVAVSKNVFNSIKTLTGVQPKRCFGKSSAGTSAALAAAGSGWSDTAIIATNKTFKDALSAAPLSYSLHMPILLADNGKSLNADVLNALKKCGIKKVIIVGGKLAVTENVEKQLVKNGIAKGKISRLAGNTAVDTSASIAEYGLKHGMTINGMGVATSQNYPDALAGAALCGHNNSVLVLADDKAMKNTSFPKNYKADFSKGYVFGGVLAVSDKVFKALQDAVN